MNRILVVHAKAREDVVQAEKSLYLAYLSVEARSIQRLFRRPASSVTVIPIIEHKVIPDSIVYSDHWRGYNALDISDFYHERINHSKLFAHGKNHINGIENFWNQAKRHMRKFNGVLK